LEQTADSILQSINLESDNTYSFQGWLNESIAILTQAAAPLAVTEVNDLVSFKMNNNLEVELAEIKRQHRALQELVESNFKADIYKL
jgi:hypothetical protein